MSFWDKVKNLTQPYDDDEEYDEDYEDDVVDTYDDASDERPARSSRRTPIFNFTSEETERSSAPERSSAFSPSMGNKQEVVLFHPANFNDTSTAADHLRSRKAVIVNMENVDKAMARRVVDFLSGCAYALDGKVKKVAQSTYLFCPHNMDIQGDLENIQNEVESYI